MASAPMARLLRRVLVLGSGKTCPPLVELLTRDGDTAVTVGEEVTKLPMVDLLLSVHLPRSLTASNEKVEADQIASSFKNAQAVPLDVTSDKNLSDLIGQHQLVIRQGNKKKKTPKIIIKRKKKSAVVQVFIDFVLMIMSSPDAV